jgi:uroporphyrinogen decarboxylase
LPEYRALRQRYSLLEICGEPELAAEAALQPVRALGVDAAILFADILLPLIPMGVDLEFAQGEGPIIHNPVRTAADVSRLRLYDPSEEIRSVMGAVRLIRSEIPEHVPLIGFAGAPFTVASYLIEGGSSRQFRLTKSMMYCEPWVWHALMEKLTRVLADYVTAQIAAGAQAIQIFDSWAGALSADDYRAYVLPHSSAVLRAAARAGVPVIHFGTNTAHLLEAMRQAGGDVIGVDWRIPLDDAWARIGQDVALQGNLDPVALFAPRPELEGRVALVLQQAAGRPGHIFNLGHGILPETPVDAVRAVVDWVHAHRLEMAPR